MNQDVFSVPALKRLADAHKQAFLNLRAVEDALNKRFFGLAEATRALSLAAACREPLLLFGPPGTAKSQLIRAFCNYLGIKVPKRRGGGAAAAPQPPTPVGIVGTGSIAVPVAAGNWQDPRYFEYLLTPFTEPGELFGYYNINILKDDGKYVRSDKGMIQKARVVYLDEVFNASSAILNSMLALLNEGYFHDRNNIVEANWQLLLGATNTQPDNDALRAVYDRFLLRCQVENVKVDHGSDDLRQLLQFGWRETHRDETQTDPVGPFPTLLADLEKFRGEAGQLTVLPDSLFYQALANVVDQARDRFQLSEMSNRRLIRFLFVMMVHAIYQYIRTGQESNLRLGKKELDLLRVYGMDRHDRQGDEDLKRLIETRVGLSQ